MDEAASTFSKPFARHSRAASASRLRVVRLGTWVPLSSREMVGANVPIRVEAELLLSEVVLHTELDEEASDSFRSREPRADFQVVRVRRLLALDVIGKSGSNWVPPISRHDLAVPLLVTMDWIASKTEGGPEGAIGRGRGGLQSLSAGDSGCVGPVGWALEPRFPASMKPGIVI